MKKYLSVLLVFGMALGLLTGCGNETGSEATDVAEATEELSHNLKDINPDDYVVLMGNYKGLEISAVKEEVTEEVIEQYISNMLDKNPLRKEVTDRAAIIGDVTNIDFVGKENDKAFDGGTANGVDLTLGSGQFIPGFEDGVVGMKIGETKDIPLTFPTDYANKDLAGKDVIFTVTVNSITELQKAELNDEFVKSMKMDNCEDVASFRVAVKEALENYAESEYQADLQQAAVNGLLQTCKFKDNVPEGLLDYCKKQLSYGFQEQLAQMNLSLDDYLKDYSDMTKEQYEDQLTQGAKSSANLQLALLKIANDENITITEEELKKAVEENYENLGYTSVDDYMKNGSPEDYRDFLLTQKVKEFLVSNAKITDRAEQEAAKQEVAETEATTSTEQ